MIKEIVEAIHRINPNAKMSINIEQGETVDNCIILWRS